ncbi:MAG: Na+/H+ antiporter, partial [Chloroflexota bacterium]|nr:Na+/H+ antiporter [Chloroflexota bacterium]
MHTFELILGLMVVVIGLAALADRLHLPYPILLVLGGLALAFVPGLPHVELEPEIVFLLFLPPILFSAAYFTSWCDFRANARAISLLAVGLVLFTTVAVAAVARWAVPGLGWPEAFVLGAIVSPPDAVATTAIMGRLGVPQRVVTVLEGESLVNDATALVALRFATAAVVTGAFSPWRAAGEFVLVVVGGVAIGLAVGWLIVWLVQRIDDAEASIGATLLAPIAAYLPAEELRVSGVLAAVTAGLFLGRRSSATLRAYGRLEGRAVWSFVVFVINGLVFVLIGLQLPAVLEALAERETGQLVRAAVAVCLVTVLIRIAWVFPATYVPRWIVPGLAARDPSPSWRPVAILSWAGLRGVVSLAAALALPLETDAGAPFPARPDPLPHLLRHPRHPGWPGPFPPLADPPPRRRRRRLGRARGDAGPAQGDPQRPGPPRPHHPRGLGAGRPRRRPAQVVRAPPGALPGIARPGRPRRRPRRHPRAPPPRAAPGRAPRPGRAARRGGHRRRGPAPRRARP